MNAIDLYRSEKRRAQKEGKDVILSAKAKRCFKARTKTYRLPKYLREAQRLYKKEVFGVFSLRTGWRS